VSAQLLESEGKRPVSVSNDPKLDKLLSLYRQMLLIRRFEEHVYFLYLQGEIPGTVHQYQGQEAVAVGICDHLAPTDWMTSTHRPHGHALAKGVPPREALAELYGKATGCCGGKGGSMHLGDPRVGMLPAIAIVGGGNSVVTGLGLACKLQQTGQIAVCFCGEGATNEGAFHESLNFAAVQNLPIVFVCENNLYGASTSYGKVSLVENVADRAAAYGVRGEVVDGMDVLAVHKSGGAATLAVRRGQGPILLECKTYRFVGHSRSDARGYRTKEEENAWKQRDPILRLRQTLMEESGVADSVFANIDALVKAELDEATDFARTSPDVTPEQALEGVYA
jgi:TPP-dependent pyruvate/acetoin dehydrogenase alpha subunit